MKDRIKKAIRDYSGKEPSTLDIVPDPYVKGVWACRAVVGGQEVDFIWVEAKSGADAEELEEVEFRSWPPRAR